MLLVLVLVTKFVDNLLERSPVNIADQKVKQQPVAEMSIQSDH